MSGLKRGHGGNSRPQLFLSTPQFHVCVILTQVSSIGGVLVLHPGDLAVLVLVILFPVLVHVLLDVPPLSVFDPVVQLGVVNEAILICVDAFYDFPERGKLNTQGVTNAQQKQGERSRMRGVERMALYPSLALLSSGVS